MKSTQRCTFLLVAATMLATACTTGNTTVLDSRTDTLSWAMGENVALTLMQGQVVDIDYDVFCQAVRHTLDGTAQPLSDSAYSEAISYIMAMAQLQHMQQQKDQHNNVDALQEEYFKNLEQTNPKVKKHPSGFYYEVLREGHGPKVKYAQSVRFDYRSYLMLSGKPFDQTYDRRPPIDHVVGKPMFPGLIEGMQLMKAGSLYRFWFPYQLAFGEAGSEPIPGFTPLIYEVEIHELLD